MLLEKKPQKSKRIYHMRFSPKFLTKELAKIAVQQVLAAVMDPSSPLSTLIKRQACHIVIVVPSMVDQAVAGHAVWHAGPLFPFVLYEQSVGNRESWTAKYDEVAHCKALQLWYERSDGATDIMPHLLFTGDTPYWGGVRRGGIVVTCSGIQPWFDRMIAGMVADMIIALAYNAWMTSEDKKSGVDFLT